MGRKERAKENELSQKQSAIRERLAMLEGISIDSYLELTVNKKVNQNPAGSG